MSDKQFVLDYIGALAGASYDCPFDGDFDTTVMRHKTSSKWFGIIMNVSGLKIGKKNPDPIDVMNLKSNPEDSIILFELYPEITPAYHMNKTHWISVPLDGSLSKNLICSLMEKSYDLTKPKRK